MYEETRERPRPALLAWIRETLTHDRKYLLALIAVMIGYQYFGYLANYEDFSIPGTWTVAGLALIIILYKLVKRWSMRAGSPARGVGMVKWHAGMQVIFMLGMMLFFSIALVVVSLEFIQKLGSEAMKETIKDDVTSLLSFWWIVVIVELFRGFLFALGFAGLFAPPPHRSLWIRVEKYGAMLGWSKIVLSILAAVGITLVLRYDLVILERIIYPLPSKALFALQCVTGFAWAAVILILHLWLTMSMVTLAVDLEFSPPKEEPDEKKE